MQFRSTESPVRTGRGRPEPTPAKTPNPKTIENLVSHHCLGFPAKCTRSTAPSEGTSLQGPAPQTLEDFRVQGL